MRRGGGDAFACRDDFQLCRVQHGVLERLVPQPSLDRCKRGTLVVYVGREIQKYIRPEVTQPAVWPPYLGRMEAMRGREEVPAGGGVRCAHSMANVAVIALLLRVSL